MGYRIFYLSPAITAKAAHTWDASLSWATMKLVGQPPSTAEPAVRPRKLSFARIEDAYEITPERWQQINPKSANPELNSHRYAKQRVCGDMFEEIINLLDAHDSTTDYLLEVARLKAESNPFKSVPSGRIFIINVGCQ